VKITLIRHGEVEEAYKNCYNGHNNIGLSRKGKEDALALAKRFENEEFDLLYCSDLLRAKETLKPFKQAKDAIYTEALREKSWGRHEGMSFDAIIAEGSLKYENFKQWIEVLDGEDYRAYIARVEEFFLKTLPSRKAESVLVITHAGVIRTLFSIVKNISLEDAFAIELPYGSAVVFDTKKQTFSTIK
jgi:alpha-ribazole phosphatase/probable phosphoglycerate mutase